MKLGVVFDPQPKHRPGELGQQVAKVLSGHRRRRFHVVNSRVVLHEVNETFGQGGVVFNRQVTTLVQGQVDRDAKTLGNPLTDVLQASVNRFNHFLGQPADRPFDPGVAGNHVADGSGL